MEKVVYLVTWDLEGVNINDKIAFIQSGGSSVHFGAVAKVMIGTLLYSEPQDLAY